MHPIKILIPLIYSSDLKEYPVDTSQSKMGFSKVLTVNAYLNATFTALVENLGTSAVVLVVVQEFFHGYIFTTNLNLSSAAGEIRPSQKDNRQIL